MPRPLIAAISVEPGKGGIAEVLRALWQVVRHGWPGSRLATLCGLGNAHATVTEKARFASRIAAAQVLHTADWTLFTHLHLLRVLELVPDALRRPYAVFLHGIEAWGPLSAGDRHRLAAARLRLANSEFTARRTMAAHPGIGPVIACPLALLPPEAPGPEPCASDPVPVGPAAVLIVGRMLAAERYKGHDQLLDAWPRVLQAVPNAQLIIVGDGDDAGRLRERAERAGAAGSVVFTGFVGDRALHSLYDRCAVFAMPSRAEGFGLVYLEAMTHALPCIGSRDDAAAEIIVDGETGLLVDQANVQELSDAIVRLLTDDDLCRRMGAAGRQRVRDCFSFERFANQVTGCLRTTFEGRGSDAPASERVATT